MREREKTKKNLYLSRATIKQMSIILFKTHTAHSAAVESENLWVTEAVSI